MNNSNSLTGGGIYVIRNTVNNKLYVGSTINFRNRRSSHFKGLRSKYHKNPRLQAAWNKYGSEAFIFEILEVIPDLLLNDSNYIFAREQYWMDFYRSYESGVGYNVLPKAGSSRDRRLSEETKQKLREINLGRKHTPEQRRAISESLKNSKLFAEGVKRGAAKRVGQKRSPEAIEKHRRAFTGMKVPAISAALKGRTRSEDHCRNLSIAKTGVKMSEEARRKMSESRKGRIHTPEAIAKMSASQKGVPRPYAKFINAKEWVVCSPEGEQQEIFSLLEFCKKNGFSESAFRQVADGKRRHAKGWRCCRVDDLDCIARLSEPLIKKIGKEKDWIVTSPDGKEFEVGNLHQFCLERGLDSSGLSKVANGKRSHCKGWKCRYADDRAS